ncbi:MAG: hypothetical protein KKH44_08755 [Bacteroidetes bacterium]|nr:hypothetical protein [Bacteroidota bacterium]
MNAVIFKPNPEWEKKRRLLRLGKIMDGFAKTNKKIPLQIEKKYCEALEELEKSEIT